MKIVIASLLFIIGTIYAFAQEPNQKQIEVLSGGRFSDEVTIILNPITIYQTPKLKFSLNLKTSLEPANRQSAFYDDVNTQLYLTAYCNGEVNFLDQTLNFLADGKRINLGKPPDILNIYESDADIEAKKGYERSQKFVSLLQRGDLDIISKSSKIEMKIGSNEITLDQDSVVILHNFAKEVFAQKKKLQRLR